MDRLFYFLALLAAAGGVATFYFFASWPGVVRGGAVVLGVLLAALLVWRTALGGRFVEFAHASVAEVRKVVWPSRKETVQATFVVFAFVVILAVFVWFVDKMLEWLFYGVVLGWR
ncbi:MAG: preprotein translocase subunit SecE [Hydrogenophilus sp.]|nr:preprotein translocase subunit SecE [Hydrogenophilus sp.]